MSATIYALASAPGRAGVAVVRVSGPEALQSLKILSAREENEFPPRFAKFCKLSNPVSGETLDHALIVFFQGPASFTGEDVVEYHLHGGKAVIDALLAALSQQKDHRLAEPGEFTRRAFENGKLDLTEAEAVADLVHAETQLQKAQALTQLEGNLKNLYDSWRERLTKMLAYAEAEIEFPDEDLPKNILDELGPGIETLLNEIGAHLNDNRRGERLRDGIRVAILGAPNAGKSSLLNALSKRDVAIVSDVAGTTRDVIEAHLDIGGYPVILADTAGLRDQLGTQGHDAIESEGVRRALARAQDADIKILLFDAGAKPDEKTLALIDETAILVANKIDAHAARMDGALGVSVKTGAGIDALLEKLLQRIESLIGNRETPSLTRARHREALEECRASLSRALQSKLPELLAEDLRLAIRGLGRVTGRVGVEDLLDVIFRDFCIGK